MPPAPAPAPHTQAQDVAKFAALADIAPVDSNQVPHAAACSCCEIVEIAIVLDVVDLDKLLIGGTVSGRAAGAALARSPSESRSVCD